MRTHVIYYTFCKSGSLGQSHTQQIDLLPSRTSNNTVFNIRTYGLWPHSVYKQYFTHSHTYHQLLIEQNCIPYSHHCEIGEAEPKSVGDIASQLSIYVTIVLSLVV